MMETKNIITDLNYSILKVDTTEKEVRALLRAARRAVFFAHLSKRKIEKKAWLVQIAQCLQSLDDYEHSEKYLKKALRLQHDDPLALLALAEVMRTCYCEREEESLNLCTAVIKENPYYAPSYYFRGLCFYEMQYFEEAIEDFSEAIRLKPEWAAPYCARGTSYTEIIKDNPDYEEDEAQEMIEQGFADFEKALELLPSYALVYFNRGSTYDDFDEYENACSDYLNAIRCGGGDYADAYFNLGCTYRKEYKNVAAVDAFTDAIKLKKNYYAAYYNRGNAYDDLGEVRKALNDYNKVIGISRKKK
ncbi:MAG: hypothetical protein Ta2A_17490 [Treponemataceae bacterium]|nr:MAG: hypothetical protein Ta2A_17490 [Treponemataceae bacterium]